MSGGNSVITFATNKTSYLTFALNLAQSVLLHNDIPVFIISNLDFPVPAALAKNVTIIKAKEEHAVLGIGMKLHIDEYIQTEKSLYIDSDCLCYSSLDPIFKAFDGNDVSVVGTIVNSEEWCGPANALAIDKEFGIKKLPRFNGGIYFLNRSEKTKTIFNLARSLMPDYDRLGFARLKNGWINEEILIALAMVIYNQTPVGDNGRYMTDLHTDHHPAQLNVLKGTRVLNNPVAGELYHRPWYPVGSYSPIILHFGGERLHSFPYVTQYALLKLKALNFNVSISSLIGKLLLQLPYKGYINLKKIFFLSNKSIEGSDSR
ncbi:MAG: hypothetical protein M3O71_08040 [Bacteroidota bacterium]|nr:hypothetical protein [Bacteroidota bacterium]